MEVVAELLQVPLHQPAWQNTTSHYRPSGKSQDLTWCHQFSCPHCRVVAPLPHDGQANVTVALQLLIRMSNCMKIVVASWCRTSIILAWSPTALKTRVIA